MAMLNNQRVPETTLEELPPVFAKPVSPWPSRNTGEVPNLFAPDERVQVCEMVRAAARQEGKAPEAAGCGGKGRWGRKLERENGGFWRTSPGKWLIFFRFLKVEEFQLCGEKWRNFKKMNRDKPGKW